ncbi:MAG: hypothetical protein WAU23_12290 [Ferruginibacter sp.]
MKKIKSIKQLRAEKRRIREHLDQQEHTMQSQWAELKYSLKPSSLIKDTFSSVLKSRSTSGFNNESLLKGTLAFGASLLVNRLANKAGKKFSGLFKKKEKQREPAN